MASVADTRTHPTPVAVKLEAEDSDYGSDLDEATVDTLFTQSDSQPTDPLPRSTIEAPTIIDDHGASKPLLRLARIRDDLSAVINELNSTCETLRPKGPKLQVSIEVEYDEGNRTAFSPSRKAEEDRSRRQRELSAPLESPDANKLSPMQRFRTQPKKPLSVTDLISPAWCEQQYWYSLTKYGRIRRTPAMKQGSSVHKVLEEQVHTEVPIEVATKEDRFALRIWNIIQGLRTLRRTGMTREMEVWGLVEGEVVNGIIDEITVTCPDEEAEARLLEEAEDTKTGIVQGRKSKPLPADQRTLTDFLTSSQTASVLEQQNGGLGGWLGTIHEKPRTLYVVDTKTRQSKSLPAPGSQTRPTQYQLMIYHRLFSTLAANGVPAERIFQRYDVQSDAMFSDTFIAQMSSLDIALDNDVADDEWSANDTQQDSVTELLSHNNLTSLWSLMITEFTRAVPSPGSISPLLTAEYRFAASGSLIGRRSFAFDTAQLDTYVQDEIKWWRGQRATKGVEVEEAFKCKICEFSEGCEWRKTKVEEGLQKVRLRMEKRRISEI
ncbi:hypothetical protein LTR08_005814 [Meristemomyces frigidus]|nr:hypothetical protein LTR08_005814 [Meristemomyces frigidus]